MSEEQMAPDTEPAPAPVPEVPVVAPEPAPEPEASAPEAEQAPEAASAQAEPSATAAAIEAAKVQAERADADNVAEAVELTHHMGVSLLHDHSTYVEVPGNERHGPRIEQVIGR